MARSDYNPGLRSRLVSYLKIVLPLIAMGLLSTVFLFQEGDKPPTGITFSEDDRDTMRDGLAVYNPRFSGVSQSGDRFFMQAAKATPDRNENPAEVALVDLVGRTEYISGLTIHLRAARGLAHLERQQVDLSGGIHVSTSDGLEGMANAGTAGLEDGSFVSDGPVSLTASFGALDAGSMRVQTETDSEGAQNQVFTFENGVKLTLDPDEFEN